MFLSNWFPAHHHDPGSLPTPCTPRVFAGLRPPFPCRWLTWGFLIVWAPLAASCGLGPQYYHHIESNLQNNHADQAAMLVAEAEDEYGSHNRLLYLMDRGMTLHVAGKYRESNQVLEEADQLIEELYTRHLRNQVASMLINDLQIPFRGMPFEQVMVNVIKAFNYAVLGDVDGALVEAKKIDHRLNVLSDAVDQDDYHEDPFARYLVGVLYEAVGDWPNAFVGYQKSYEAYQRALPWHGLSPPPVLGRDLLRITTLLHLDQDFERYRREFPDVELGPEASEPVGSQLVVVGLNGRAPYLENVFVDVPVSLRALNVVAATKSLGRRQRHAVNDRAEALLYGIHGQIVRVAVPELVPQKTRVASATLRITGAKETRVARTERVYDGTAVARKNFDDHYPAMLVKTVARVATKMGAAEGIGIGAGAAADHRHEDLVRVLVSAVARIVALMTEEADTRSWRTLPDEIQLARLRLSPGTYTLHYQPVDDAGRPLGAASQSTITLQPGQIRFITKRVIF